MGFPISMQLASNEKPLSTKETESECGQHILVVFFKINLFALARGNTKITLLGCFLVLALFLFLSYQFCH